MLEFLFAILSSVFGCAQFVLAVAAVVDIIRTGRSWGWALLVFLLPFAGPIIYFANFYIVDSFGWRRFDTRFQKARRLKHLKDLSKIQDTAALHQELGELLYEKGENMQAIASLQRALELAPDMLRAHYYAGRALQALGEPEGAVAHLEYVVDADPKYLYGEAYVALARALEASGRRDDAFAACERALAISSIPEVVCMHATMLRDRGERDRARTELERLVREANAFPHFQPARDKQWIRAARKMLKAM